MVYALITVIAFALAVLILLSVIGYRRIKARALDKIQYSRYVSSDGVFVGDTLEFTETTVNPSWVPIFSLKMEFYVPSGITVDGLECKEYTKLTSIFNLPPYSTVTKKHTVRVDKRGKFHFHDASFSYRNNSYTYELPIDFFGYPDISRAGRELPADILTQGNSVSSSKYIEDPFFLSGIREYRAGDPLRSINFKASVRSFSGGLRRLMCNNYDSSRSYDIIAFLDLNRYNEAVIHSDEQLELGLKYACYLFCEAIENGGRFGFAVNSASGSQQFAFIPCESGELHIKRILEQFAVLDVFSKRDYSMAALMRNNIEHLTRGTDIYLITPYIDENTSEMLFDLERSGRNVQVISVGGARL